MATNASASTTAGRRLCLTVSLCCVSLVRVCPRPVFTFVWKYKARKTCEANVEEEQSGDAEESASVRQEKYASEQLPPPSERGRGSACTRSIQTFASAARSVHTS